MPIIKSQKKRVLITKEENARNNSIRSEVKNAVKKYELSIAENRLDDAAELLKNAISVIDEAKSKGVYHINTVSRKKARLTKMYDQAVKASKEA